MYVSMVMSHVLKLTQQFDRHPAHQFSELELTQEQLKAAFEGLEHRSS